MQPKSLNMIRFSVLCCACLVVLSSCQEKLPKDMIALEKGVASAPTNANVTKLVGLYDTWLQANPDLSPLRQNVLEKELSVSMDHQRYTSAVGALQALLIDYPEDPGTQDRLVELGGILAKTGKSAAAQTLFQCFVDKYPNDARTKDLEAKYPQSVPVDTFIYGIGQEIFGDSTVSLNEEMARQYVDVCEAYALVNHGTDASAEYLHKASETARTLRSTAKAISIYDWIQRAYPNHKRSAQALFLKGFTYDNDLHDFDKAKEVYTEFLAKYPNDEFASSAQFLLENLGKSDDELLEALQKKASESKKPQ